jgi:hypothetical protein
MEEYFKQNLVKPIKCLRLLEEHFLRHNVETNVSDNTLAFTFKPPHQLEPIW